MFRKLLALTLCFLALTPQRFCTCAAASTPCVDSACRLAPSAHQVSVPPAASCGHAHHDDETSAQEPSLSPGVVSSDPNGTPTPEHRHRGQHRPDCGAVSPASAWVAVTPAPVDAPVAGLATATPAYDADFAPVPPRLARPAVLWPPYVPLFLSLLVLRN